MIRRGMRLFILISMASSTIAIDGAVFRHSADAASHSPLEHILDAVHQPTRQRECLADWRNQ